MARTVAVRLVAFVLVLVGTFGTAYGMGRRLPGNPESKPHTHGPTKPSLIPPGFTVDGYTLVIESSPSTSVVALHIDGPDGERVTGFVEDQGATLHVILIRPDLGGFEHPDPEIAADGSFVVPIDHPGKWHIIIDSHPAGAAAPIVLATNIDDEKSFKGFKLPAANDTPAVDGLTIVRNGLNFTVAAEDGSAATGLEPYLGQAAHLIAIRKDTLAYTHLIPVDSKTATFAFSGELAAGTYRLFLQFGHDGQVVTASFTVVQP
jgi:hypothetical protein